MHLARESFWWIIIIILLISAANLIILWWIKHFGLSSKRVVFDKCIIIIWEQGSIWGIINTGVSNFLLIPDTVAEIMSKLSVGLTGILY